MTSQQGLRNGEKKILTTVDRFPFFRGGVGVGTKDIGGDSWLYMQFVITEQIYD